MDRLKFQRFVMQVDELSQRIAGRMAPGRFFSQFFLAVEIMLPRGG